MTSTDEFVGSGRLVAVTDEPLSTRMFDEAGAGWAAVTEVVPEPGRDAVTDRSETVSLLDCPREVYAMATGMNIANAAKRPATWRGVRGADPMDTEVHDQEKVCNSDRAATTMSRCQRRSPVASTDSKRLPNGARQTAKPDPHRATRRSFSNAIRNCLDICTNGARTRHEIMFSQACVGDDVIVEAAGRG